MITELTGKWKSVEKNTHFYVRTVPAELRKIIYNRENLAERYNFIKYKIKLQTRSTKNRQLIRVLEQNPDREREEKKITNYFR